jgi:hypothetical protein
VVDSGISDAWRTKIEAAGVNLLVAPPENQEQPKDRPR